MKIILGLGNPGKQYGNTRHNFGFMVADEIARKYGATFRFEKKLKSEIAEIFRDGEKIILAKPQTMMNNSGQAARAILDFYKEPSENLTVVHDDADFPLGETRLAFDRGPGGHNGIISVIDHLKTKNFNRLRLGVRPSGLFASKKPANDLVLKNFSFLEKRKLAEIKKKAAEILGL